MPMKYHSTFFINLCAASSALLLAACGGGGGGSETENTAPSTPIVINANNSVAVASEVISTTLASDDASTVLGAKTDSGSGLNLNNINKNIIQIIANHSSNGQIVSGIVEACSLGGSISKPDTKFGTYVFNNCMEPDLNINGNLTVSGSGDLINSFNGSYRFGNLSITTPSGTDVINGSINTSWTFDGTLETGSTSSQKLSLISGADFYDLINLQDDYTSNNNIQIDTDIISYTMNSSLLDGQVTLSTPIQIQSYTYNDYPFAGQIICIGANNSKVKASVNPGGSGISSDTVTIETDADGDDVYELSQVLMWSEL